MKENFNEFITTIEQELPDLVTPDHLLKIGVGGNHTMLFRLRKSGKVPFLKLSNARIVYLKSDIISWLKSSYEPTKESLDKEREHVISS